MALATWWKGDSCPELRPLPGLQVKVLGDNTTLAHLNRIDRDEVVARRSAGHRPYVAYVNGTAVSYGWVATESASIGELKLAFNLPPTDRYLWDFATLPEWQGRGIYPHLLQAILEQESTWADRFWIIHAPENTPSGAGMNKAGLLPVGILSFRADGGVGLAPIGATERAAAGATLLGVPLVDTVVAPCWCCGSLIEQPVTAVNPDRCWPPAAANPIGSCSCTIEKRPSERLEGLQDEG
jgi:GNAT superfamily N-acetyltransferase